MELEINKELVLSTAHISEETNNYLQLGELIDYSSDECNYRLYVNHDVKFSNFEAYPDLVCLLILAKSHNCKWLVLDRDGDVVEGLPIFEW
jgi:hypothetical protein